MTADADLSRNVPRLSMRYSDRAITLERLLGERQKLIQALGDDVNQNWEQQVLVAMG
jgi:hypothetical protein